MLTFLFLHISEQGRRNDLNNKKNDVNGLISVSASNCSDSVHLKNRKNDVNGLISVSASNSSDSVHCNLSTQFTVSTGWSCHTTASCADTDDDHDSSSRLSCPGTPHSWVHVSRSSTSTSLRTQCAAEAYRRVQSTKVLHRRSRRAKKKEQKLTSILRICCLLPEKLKLTHQQIGSEVIVFDGGNLTCPPIKPPHGLQWKSYPVNMLHVEDEINPNLGLTYHKIDGNCPFMLVKQMICIILKCSVTLTTKS